jgi:class 3 adenylate cyclase
VQSKELTMLSVREEDIDRITEALYHVLAGDTPDPVILPADYPKNEVRQAVEYLNRFLGEYRGLAENATHMSRGDLSFTPTRSRMHVVQSLKHLHASLRHLTWKTQQIAEGDLSQEVDFMGDFSTAFNQMTQQLRDSFARIEEQNRALSEANEAIRIEKEKADALLLNILPESVAEDLKETGTTRPTLFEDVTVSFSDMVGFTSMCSGLSPERLIDELNDIFTAFDGIVEEHGCERIKTIGDAYLAVCGMPEPNENHAERMVRAAVAMAQYLAERNARCPLQWRMRSGVHTGPVIGAVVGVKKYIYDVFGDTINTASRMESHAPPMRVNVSSATHDRVSDQFSWEEQPVVEVKGKGPMRMFLVR